MNHQMVHLTIFFRIAQVRAITENKIANAMNILTIAESLDVSCKGSIWGF